MNIASKVRTYRLPILLAILAALFTLLPSPPAQAEGEDWSKTVDEIHQLISKIPDQYAAQDQTGYENSIKKAYNEVYQPSGLQDQILHRLGRDEANRFNKNLLDLRKDLRSGTVTSAEVKVRVDEIYTQLQKDVADLASAKTISDQWTRVANSIVDKADEAVAKYRAGDLQGGYQAATDAYLGHYEADGLEKATIAYISNSRVSDVEAAFRDLRVTIRDNADETTVVDAANKLKDMVTTDAKKLDEMSAQENIGWSGFFAAFFILLREGAEALLVVAAVITYLLKANRKEKLPGVIIGIVAALLASAGIAVLFSVISASASSGFGQELLEGITGIAAVIMLIYVSNWILSKSAGDAWEKYIKKSVGAKSTQDSAFALWSVVFLAVLREGAETILFFQPIFSATKTQSDRLMVWVGVLAAAVILTVLFLLVWLFGIRLPLKPFFRWTSFLLALLSVTMIGGAVKEFQDAMIVPVTSVPGVPEITWLGLYPTVQTIAAQVFIAAILAVLGVLQLKKKTDNTTSQGSEENLVVEKSDDTASDEETTADLASETN